RDHAVWALRSDSSQEMALYLMAAIKARKSPLLGFWWRYSVWLGALGEGRAMAVLLFVFAAYRILDLALRQSGWPQFAEMLGWVWLGVCAYTWVGPVMFQRALVEELGQVKLDEDF
ncbi:MAG: hypothetical protein AAFU79_28910, partial [Myxococcota bacterium]